MESSQEERHHVGGHSTFKTDMNYFVIRTYGCGICDEIIAKKERFLEHSYNHYSDQEDISSSVSSFHCETLRLWNM